MAGGGRGRQRAAEGGRGRQRAAGGSSCIWIKLRNGQWRQMAKLSGWYTNIYISIDFNVI